VAKGGAIVGGAYGRGEVYEQGQKIGWSDLSQATIGAQLSGQTFSELILFVVSAVSAAKSFAYAMRLMTTGDTTLGQAHE